MLDKQIILLRGKKIEAVGGDIKIPKGAKILDLSGKTRIPCRELIEIATPIWRTAHTTTTGILHRN